MYLVLGGPGTLCDTLETLDQDAIGTVNGGIGNCQLALNYNEPTDWLLHSLLVWDSGLSTTTMKKVTAALREVSWHRCTRQSTRSRPLRSRAVARATDADVVKSNQRSTRGGISRCPAGLTEAGSTMTSQQRG